MTATLTKRQIVDAVASLPDDATVDDAIERLLFLSRIEQGLAEVRRGEVLSHDEVRRRLDAKMSTWRT
jgi:predicted transcriptional regulator